MGAAYKWLSLPGNLDDKISLTFFDDGRDECAVILAKENPSYVLSGLSTVHDAGLDEKMLMAAKKHGIACGNFQDFWGEVNVTLDILVDHYFVLDKAAADITKTRLGNATNCVATGYIKRFAYEDMDAFAQKEKLLNEYGLDDGKPLYVWLGQDLYKSEGYRKTFEDFAQALIQQDKECRLIYRPHPRTLDASAELAYSASLFEKAPQVEIIDAQDYAYLDLIILGNFVFSSFSTSLIDKVYLNAGASRSTGAAVICYYDEEIKTMFPVLQYLPAKHFEECYGIVSVDNAQGFNTALENLGKEAFKERLWHKQNKLKKSSSLDIIFQEVEAAL
jgi:hypothetical protein